MTEPRVLDAEQVASLDAYRSSGVGRGLEAARRLNDQVTDYDALEASVLRGRGGARFSNCM